MKKALTILFWVLFLGFFAFRIIPNYRYLTEGMPAYMGRDTFFEQAVLLLHIGSGTIVYITAVFQFIPAFRNSHISLHRKLGKLYIVASLISILSLYLVLQGGLCEACRPSQYMVTSLWLLFVVAAYVAIRRRKIKLHQRLMISGFICAAYFVSIRVVDMLAMDLFRAVFGDGGASYLASDIFVWAVPLIIAWTYWLVQDRAMPRFRKQITLHKG